jgi:hypothetical protein
VTLFLFSFFFSFFSLRSGARNRGAVDGRREAEQSSMDAQHFWVEIKQVK